MMRRLSSFASAWNCITRKSSRGKRRSRRYSPGTYAAAAYAHLAVENLESRIALSTTPPVLVPASGLFTGEGYMGLGGQGQTMPFMATFTQAVDSGHPPDDFNQVIPNYSATIDWDANDSMNPVESGAAFITKWDRTASGYLYTGRIEGSHIFAAAGSYDVGVTLDDGFGNIVSTEFTIEVFPMASNTPELAINPVSLGDVNEGSPYAITLTSNLPTPEYKINWSDGAVTGASGASAGASHTYADDLFGGTFQVYGAVSSDGNTWKFNVGPNVNVVDVAPIGAITGATTATVGETYTLQLSATDPGDDPVVNWIIDWNYNGVFANPNFPDDFYDGISSATHVFNAPGTYTIYAEGSSVDGAPVFANQVVVTVTDDVEAPIANAGGPYTTLADVPITLSGSATGGAGNYTYSWDLDADNIYGEVGEVGQNVTFNPAGVPGAKIVKLKVKDQNNVESEVVQTTVNVQATGAMVVDSKLHVVGSSTGSDNVSVTVSGGNIIVNNGSGPQSFSLASVQELNIRSGGGNDVINIAAGVLAPTIVDAGDGNDLIVGGNGRSVLMGGAGADIVYGGAGDDVLLGGTGNDLVLGGAGNDSLVGGGGVDILEGGAGRDLLVGGIGNDALLGGDGDDILIGGYTVHDGNVAALDSIMGIWSGSGSLNARVALLTAVGGLLELNIDVFDDDAIDLITGGAGADFIIADRSLLGDGAIDLIALQSAQDRLIALN